MGSNIFIDECGYTGEDLFNPDQPVFVLSSTNLSEDMCQQLKDKHFSMVNAQELKHNRLAKNYNQQQMLINLLRDMANQQESVKFAVSHKRYILITKIVDLLIEPMAYEDGIDFYENGLNIAYSNMLYILTLSMAGNEFFEKMILNFQIMMRKRTKKSYDSFFKLFFDNEFPKELNDFLSPLKLSHVKYGYSILDSMPDDSLDIAFAEAITLVAEWSKSIDGNMTLIHDKSSNMAKNKKIWDKILHPDIPEKIVGYDRRTTRFPIRVEKTEFENSKAFAGLQIVDILSGAMARCMRWVVQGKPDNDEYSKELETFLLESFGGHVIWPSSNVTPDDLGTVGPKHDDAIQHFIDLIKDIEKN